MAIFIGGVMVLSMLGFAMLQSTPEERAPVELDDVLNRRLSTEERISALRNGRTVIEYFYNESCAECPEKAGMYRKFVESEESEKLLVLSYGVAENETADWMINLDGTRIELDGVNSTGELKSLFCDVALIKPDICILESL